MWRRTSSSASCEDLFVVAVVSYEKKSASAPKPVTIG
jgi:hypothetical protein